MTDPNNIRRSPGPSKTELLLDFVKARFWSIAIVGGLVVLAFVYFEVDPTVPRWAKLGLLVALFVSPVGYIAGNYITSLLYDPNYVYVLDIDAARFDGALFCFPYEDFIRLDVVDGELDQVASNLYIGKKVDLEEMTIEGTWRGSMTDRELLTAVTKIWEFRYLLEPDAREGFLIKTTRWAMLRTALVETTAHVVETFEKNTLPDSGDALEAVVDDVLEQWNLDDDVEEEMRELDVDPGNLDERVQRDLLDDSNDSPKPEAPPQPAKQQTNGEL